jgi:hypothetical protein
MQVRTSTIGYAESMKTSYRPASRIVQIFALFEYSIEPAVLYTSQDAVIVFS